MILQNQYTNSRINHIDTVLVLILICITTNTSSTGRGNNVLLIGSVIDPMTNCGSSREVDQGTSHQQLGDEQHGGHGSK